MPVHEARGAGFVLLLGTSRGRARLVGPDLRVRHCRLASLRTALAWPHEAPLVPEVQRLLKAASVQERRRPQVLAAMLAERLAGTRGQPCWTLRLPPGAPFAQHLQDARVPQRLALMLAAFAAVYAVEICGWSLIGDGVLNGRLDSAWLAAWLLLMLSLVPLQALGGWLNAGVGLHVGRLLKQRLLAGALQMDLQAVRTLGVGRLLGRVIESQALESQAVSGAIGVGVAGLELAFAAWVLAQGAAPAMHGLLLLFWAGLAAALVVRQGRRSRQWTGTRLELTHELIEQMVGHRTRLAQERPGRRDRLEDASLHAYLQASAAMDRASAPVMTLLPSGWLLVALAGLAPAFVAGASASALAVSMGGVLLAQRALGSLAGGIGGLLRATIAWDQVAALFRAGAQGQDPGTFVEPALALLAPAAAARRKVAVVPASPMAPTSTRELLVDAQGIDFAHAGGAPVLRQANLQIRRGERLLLQGASGSGKSTLASLLCGLRTPDRGLLLLRGLDRHTLGVQWQALATAAPQFHENHVFSGTLAFNLLLGREWPASAAALREAEQMLHDLGLSELVQRMPGGLSQHIGETGWQLSHGERSRIFLARALLQRAPLTVMDESFAALDPMTLERCLRAAMRRADTLVVIAHP